MLEKLLERIDQSGMVSPARLAVQLGVSLELVESMLADLARWGYLQQMDGCGQKPCAGCSISGACRPKSRVWVRKV